MRISGKAINNLTKKMRTRVRKSKVKWLMNLWKLNERMEKRRKQQLGVVHGETFFVSPIDYNIMKEPKSKVVDENNVKSASRFKENYGLKKSDIELENRRRLAVRFDKKGNLVQPGRRKARKEEGQ